MTVALIRPEHVDLAWPTLWPMLERAARRTPGRTEAEVRDCVDRDHAQLWAVIRHHEPVAAIVTQIVLVPVRHCCLWLIGGTRLREWAAEFMSIVEPWARDRDCRVIWGGGRPGWARIVRRMGGEPMDMPEGPGWARRII